MPVSDDSRPGRYWNGCGSESVIGEADCESQAPPRPALNQLSSEKRSQVRRPRTPSCPPNRLELVATR